MPKSASTRRVLLAAALLFCAGSDIRAQDAVPQPPLTELPPGDGTTSTANLDLLTGRDAMLVLESGEVFRGRLLGHGGGTVSLRNQFAGEFEVPVDRVRSVDVWMPPQPPPPVAPVNPLVSVPVESQLPLAQEVVVGLPTPVAPPAPAVPPPDGTPQPATPAAAAAGFWEREEYSFEGGLSGSSGQTERSSLRFGFVGRWSNPTNVLTIDSRYISTRDRGNLVQDRFEGRGRHDWISADSPWQFFMDASGEVDRFTPYDALARIGGGVGYRFINSERTTLVGRLGAGMVQEFGSDDDNPRPEGILGVDFSHKLDSLQSFVLNAEAFPSLEDFERYRTRTRAYYEVRLSEKTNLNLRLGVEHRYDSIPGENGGGATNRENLDYAATIVIRF
ncbi:MAG: YdiY family protein [Phycisphaerales bacterium]